MKIIKIGSLEIDVDLPLNERHSEKTLLHHILAQLKHNEHKQNERHKQIMTALETVNASVAANTKALGDLTTEVDDAVTHIGNPGATDAQLLTLASAIDANTAGTAAQGKRLADAISALTPPPPPAP